MQKEWTKEEIVELLLRNDKAVCKGIVRLYYEQTLEERSSHTTKSRNGRGFNGVDAEILTSFAKFYIQKGYLSPKQILIGRKKIIKYAQQLSDIAQERRAAQC